MAEEDKKLPKATPHIQDVDLGEAAKVHRDAEAQIRHFQELNKKKRAAAHPKPPVADIKSAPSPKADAVGVHSEATGPTATEAGKASH